MKTFHRAARAIRTGFGLALLAALAFVTGCMSEDGSGVSEPSAEPSSAAAVDALYDSAPVGIWTCHRHYQPRSLVVTPGPFGNNSCAVTARLAPGSSDLYCPDDGCLPCSELQKLWKCSTS